MYRQVFANRWIALLFVLVIAAGAASLVGTEEEAGVLDKATQQIAEQQSDFERAAQAFSGPDEPSDFDEQEADDFYPEADLIDDAAGSDVSGFDPNPVPNRDLDPRPDIDPRPDLDPAPAPEMNSDRLKGVPNFGQNPPPGPPPPGATANERVIN